MASPLSFSLVLTKNVEATSVSVQQNSRKGTIKLVVISAVAYTWVSTDSALEVIKTKSPIEQI